MLSIHFTVEDYKTIATILIVLTGICLWFKYELFQANKEFKKRTKAKNNYPVYKPLRPVK